MAPNPSKKWPKNWTQNQPKSIELHATLISGIKSDRPNGILGPPFPQPKHSLVTRCRSYIALTAIAQFTQQTMA